MQIEEYLEYIQTDYDFITYEIYCNALDLVMSNQLTEGFFDNIKQMRLSRELLRVFNDLRTNLIKISKEFRIGSSDLVSAFKQKEVFEVLKAFKFNINLIVRAVGEFTKFLRGGLLEVFKELHRTKAIQKLQKGIITVDQILDKHPILKRVTGIAVAGLLLYIWLNMTFIGDLDYDFNFSDTLDAVKGSFSIASLFASPEGLMMVTMFGTGAVFGLSVPWLGRTAYNLILALVYTAYYKYKGNDKKYNKIIENFKKKLKRERLR